MTASTPDSESWAEGLQSAAYLQIASVSLILWEHCITIDTETRLFWTGRWTKTRILFLLNRYSILLLVCIELLNNLQTPSKVDSTCSISVILEALNITVVHAIHGLRVWHLFSRSAHGRVFVLMALMSCTAGVIVISEEYIKAEDTCFLPPTDLAARLYWIPTFILHSLLYALTALWAVHHWSTSPRGSPITSHLVREGGMFMLICAASSIFTAVGANSDSYRIFLPATAPLFAQPLLSIAMSRLIMSLGSLAADLAIEPDWLLSHLELSRVHWKRGAHERELIVEVDPVNVDEHELSSHLYGQSASEEAAAR